MSFDRILITGGAGFVGSNLALRFRQMPSVSCVLAVDNLKRRGSELALQRLRDAGVEFRHTDIRCWDDLEDLPDFDLLIDCAAEPSVQAGMEGSPLPVLNANLFGTIQCLELARRRQAAFLFLSTSRVYPIQAINEIPFTEDVTRFRWIPDARAPGISEHGIAENFPLEGTRSYYGTSKLASEHIIQEYVANSGVKALINRCGVLAGPWQMGKVDQGVITLWVARHLFGLPLKYIGFGGTGKQVRDVLHVEDLFDLVCRQFDRPELWDGRVYNAGGGRECSVSLCELTTICQEVTGKRLEIAAVPETSPVDLRIYLTDNRKVEQDFGWRPMTSPYRLVSDIHDWLVAHAEVLRGILS